jgi:primosomal protein N' (replication factor Y)
VPLGSRVVTGCVVDVDVSRDTDSAGVKDLIESLDTDAFLPRSVLEIALWVAQYYAAGAGDALAAAMPPFAWIRGTKRTQRATAFKTVRMAFVTAAGRDLVQAEGDGFLGCRQRDALGALVGAPDGLSTKNLADRGVTADAVRRLIRRGLITVERKRVDRDPFVVVEGPPGSGDVDSHGAPLALTGEQRAALESLTELAAAKRFRVALLHGGKTEVYLRLAREVHARGGRSLILVPEIALAPAVTRAFQGAFGGRVAVQHSGLSDGERYDQWHRIRRGEVDVVVGTRSGVFAPLDELGLIVIDEEHDASYKQEESPRYHGRDVAIMRGQQAGALVVLGSATPSMESYHNAMSGRYALVTLGRRVLERPLATVQIVDMRTEMASDGADLVLSTPLREALAIRLERKEQALVLLNRRGYAAAVLCRQCGRTVECPNCSVTLTLHRAAGRVQCHYCNYSLARPKTCPHCAGPFLERVGFGTERIEREVSEAFPTASVARFDRDAVRRRGVAQLLLSRFERREIDVLVGTQMIAKGHDFPAVTLVGVISADVGLGLADFRAAERTFQLLTQVAGRAGRGDLRGEAIIQTFYPDHYSVQLACRQAYVPFFEAEMRFRRSMRYPPVVAMVNAVVRGRSFEVAMRAATDLENDLRAAAGDFRVLGPAPAPLARLRGEYRVQIFLKGTRRRAMREAVQMALARRPGLRRYVTVDVDPLTVL